METLGFSIIMLLVIGYALVSRKLATSIITPPMVFTAAGFVLGGSYLGVVDLEVEHSFIHTLSEVTLVLVLFSDAASVDLKRLRTDHVLPQRMLLIGLPLTILLGAVVALLVPLGLGLWEAALLAAILAPTDAALGQAVVTSSLVPNRIRQTLNVESGLNDGIALPIVLLFATIVGAVEGEQDTAMMEWLTFGANQILLGPLAGVVVGTLLAKLIDWSALKGWIDESFEGAAILSVSLLAYSSAQLIGGNGFIAAFVSGMIFGNVVRGRCKFVLEFAEAEGQILVLLVFLFFGATILPEALESTNLTMLLYAGLSLTVVRMLPVFLSLRGTQSSPATVAFLGWFGPRGLASLLFALFVTEDFATPSAISILNTTVLTVACSILLHGLTAAPLARAFGQHQEHISKDP